MFRLKPPPSACSSHTAHPCVPFPCRGRCPAWSLCACPRHGSCPSCLLASSLPLRQRGGKEWLVGEMESRQIARGLSLMLWAARSRGWGFGSCSQHSADGWWDASSLPGWGDMRGHYVSHHGEKPGLGAALASPHSSLKTGEWWGTLR